MQFDISGIHEVAPMELLHFFMMKQAAFPLKSSRVLRARPWRRCQKEGTLTKYFELVNNFFETYSIDDVIDETDVEIWKLI